MCTCLWVRAERAPEGRCVCSKGRGEPPGNGRHALLHLDKDQTCAGVCLFGLGKEGLSKWQRDSVGAQIGPKKTLRELFQGLYDGMLNPLYPPPVPMPVHQRGFWSG